MDFMATTYNMYTTPATSSAFAEAGIWVIISFILAIIGGILLYVLFTTDKNEGKFKGFLGWVYSFLRFDKMLIEILLKVVYMIGAIFITLASFALIPQSFLSFILMLVFGNVALRLGFEASMVAISIWKNTTVIRENSCKCKEKIEKK